ncbi:MAG: helix-turn-helix domain-containing protein [Ruminococcaceae bacterium]|nr:helix-turn-helix domain-containing protein [Oscillospiraceae bacterium]
MKHKNFFIIPNQIFELGLKPKEFVVYCCLLRHSDKNTDNCFPSRRLIADECSMDIGSSCFFHTRTSSNTVLGRMLFSL